MQNDIFHIKEHHIKAAEEIYSVLAEKIGKNKFIVTVAGEVSSGKTTLAYLLGRMMKMDGIRVKILDLVDFYKVAPLERRAYRKKHGVKSVGVDEYDWEKIELVI